MTFLSSYNYVFIVDIIITIFDCDFTVSFAQF